MSKAGSDVANFLPEQYRQTNKLAINHNYLYDQFADRDVILAKIREVVVRGDFTLGEEVDKVEAEFAKLCNTKHAIGVGSGTDALFLSLKALGVKEGDEVITTPFTFYATIGAIVTAGAKPVFVDVGDDYNINAANIEAKVTKNTKAIMPVHWAGRPCDMDKIEAIGKKHGIPVVSDACHAIKSTYKGRQAGELGTVACFSFHPLKNLNIWGDGGIVATNSDDVANKLRLLRNHGLINRDECEVFAYNSRLDTVQAVVARHMLGKIDHITSSRIAHAKYFDEGLRGLNGIQVPQRDPNIQEVFHLYSVLCDDRDNLQKYLVERDVDAKVHYPIPMHLQPAAKSFGHKPGDFPAAENVCRRTLSLPVHEFVTREQQDHVIALIKKFYGH
jgi:dTDP-4-amino-4,6-dideoxygalactose transaminase